MRATHSDPAKIKIGLRSLEFLRRLQPEFGYDVDYVEGGYLFPAYQESIAAKLKGLLAIQKDLGLNIDWIGPEEVVELVPGIREDGLLGGTYSPEDGHLSPLKLECILSHGSIRRSRFLLPHYRDRICHCGREGDGDQDRWPQLQLGYRGERLGRALGRSASCSVQTYRWCLTPMKRE